MNKKKNKIILISSSTGGHAIPVFELYKEFKKDASVLVKIVHTGSAVEKQLFPDSESFIIISGKINRHQFLKNIIEIIKIFYATLRSLYLIIIYKPRIIFSKGGFNSVPLLFWAKLLKIPYFIHESDSEMGLANKFFYRSSVKTFVSFPVDTYNLDKSKLDYSGMIIRDFDGIKPYLKSRPIILVTGGSQGAKYINKCIFSILPELLQKYNVIHQIGRNEVEDTEDIIRRLPINLSRNYEYFIFSKEKMERSLISADLIISRSGSTIGEIARLSKASILIPYPFAASDHQAKNAKYLEKIGGAIVIRQDLLKPSVLLDRINFILSNQKNVEVISSNAKKSIKTNGRDYVIRGIKKYLGDKI